MADMMADMATEGIGADARRRAERILARHGFHPVFGCDCMPTDEETGVTETLDGPWERHVAELLFPAQSEEGA